MMSVLTIALGPCRIAPFAGWRLCDSGDFIVASGMGRVHDAPLPLLRGGRPMLTRHRLFCPGTARGPRPAGPAALPLYRQPSDGNPEGNN